MPHLEDPHLIALQRAIAGRYSLVRQLGRGGMGIVYLARDVSLDRHVAIKLLPQDRASSDVLRQRFLREARTAAGISHPNVVPIHLVEEAGDTVYFVMSYVEGESLRERVERLGPLPVPEATRVLQEVAWALGAAHANGIVHRDIKPDNILLERDSGRALVTDFGIAHIATSETMTERGDVLGTPHYLSPEQSLGETVTPPSDIYSLGVTAFYALTGRPPFDADSAHALLAKHVTEQAPPVGSVRSEVPNVLAQIVDRCLAKDASERFATGRDLAEALDEVRRASPELPRALGEFRSEVSRFAVDTGGYLALIGVMVLAPVTDVFFFGIDQAMRLGVTFLAVGLELVTAAALFARARRLQADRYRVDEIQAAFLSSGAAGVSPRQRGRNPGWSVLNVGLGALFVGFFWWGGGDDWLSSVLPDPLGLVAYGAAAGVPVAIGRWAVRITFDHVGWVRRGWARLWGGRGGRLVLKLARLGLGTPELETAAGDPTEVVLADAAAAVYRDLRTSHRSYLGEVPSVIERLEHRAEALRKREAELSKALAAAGPDAFSRHSGGLRHDPDRRQEAALLEKRSAAVAELERARSTVHSRLAAVVAALENIRIDLLRLQAGVGTVEDITADLAVAREIGEAVDRLIQGQLETRQTLREAGP